MKEIITELINLMTEYTDFNEDDVKCELFSLLKNKGHLVRSEYPKTHNRHDLALIDKNMKLYHVIEIKVKPKVSLNNVKDYLFSEDYKKDYGECEAIYKRKELDHVKEGTVIFFNLLKDPKYSVINQLNKKGFARKEIVEEYNFIKVFYVEFVKNGFKYRFLDGLEFYQGKICKLIH